MYWLSKSIHWLGRFRRRGLILLAVIGPGIITMVADNDAGGISTYAETGAKTGFNLLWAFIILVPMAYYVQEMTVRLGAVTKRGHAEAIFDAFGSFWGWFSIFDLALINWLTLITEYIGMIQAMSIFNIPQWLTFLCVTLLMFAIVVTGKYWTFEKLTLFFCLFNLVYIPAALWAMQTGNVTEGWTAVGRGFFRPEFRVTEVMTGAAWITLIMANIGTTITPWQIFFQQSAVVNKGMERPRHPLRQDRHFCRIAGDVHRGSLHHHCHGRPVLLPSGRDDAGRVGRADGRADGRHHDHAQPSTGPMGAGPVCDRPVRRRPAGRAVHFALHELGRGRGLRLGPLAEQERPRGAWFYVVYLGMLISAGLTVLLTTEAVQDSITKFVQVVAVTLLPAALTFLILLLNDKQLMGEYVNTLWENIANWAIVLFVIIVSTIYGIYVLFG